MRAEKLERREMHVCISEGPLDFIGEPMIIFTTVISLYSPGLHPLTGKTNSPTGQVRSVYELVPAPLVIRLIPGFGADSGFSSRECQIEKGVISTTDGRAKGGLVGSSGQFGGEG